MIDFLFDITELDSVRKKSLQAILFVLLLESSCEVEVSPVEFPDKFQINVERGLDGCGFGLVWDDEKSGFYFERKKFEIVLSAFVSDSGMKMLSKLLVR